MALFADNNINEIKLVYKLSAGSEAQQILLKGSRLQDNTGFHIHISRCC